MNTKSAMCITLVALVSPAALIAQEQQPDMGEVVQAEAAAEVNKAVTTRAKKVTAKSRVEEDIRAYCTDAGIVLGAVRPDGALYISGIERVNANAKSPNFVRSRTMAYAKAYQKAVAVYVLNKFGV